MPYLVADDMTTLMSKIDVEPVFLVYYYDPACAPCTAVSPRLEQLMEDFSEVWWTKINIAEQTEIAGQHLIFTVPTLRIFYRGNEYYKEGRFIDLNRVSEALQSLVIRLEDSELID